MKKLFFIALALTMFFFSCKEDEDMEKPAITIMTPEDATTYMNGDSMHVHGMITDNEGLHEVTLNITTIQQGTVIHDTTYHTHDNPHHFNYIFVVNVPMHTDILITVTAEDENGNVGEATRQKHIMQ